MPLPANEYLKALEENPWIDEFAELWILDKDAGTSNEHVADLELSLFASEMPDSWLSAIVGIAIKMQDSRHDAILAAGMLENFLGKHGKEYAML